MKKAPVNLAVLFADISGSTRLYEKLGDARALECIGLCLKIMRDVAKICEGRVVKTIGDEIMCVFPGASAAAQAAIDMQARVDMQAPVGGHPLQIRVGVQFGPVLQEDEDVFGDCVNVAARMVNFARPAQIMVAGECVQAMNAGLKAQTRAIDKLPVKGRDEEIEVYELLWRQGEDMTTLASLPPVAPRRSRAQLRLRHNGKELLIGANHDVVRFGRDVSCDVVVADRKASREHARIERRRDKYVLVDVSSNGTFLTFHGGREMALRREEVVLHGSGSISFGHAYGADPTEIATFEVET
jgi:class 3 adenylate cyclase